MKKLLIALICVVPLSLLGADNDSLSWKGSSHRPSYRLNKLTEGFSLGGYYRFYGLNRNLVEPFRVLSDNQFANTPPFVFGVGDVYRDPPIFLMTASVRPGGGASISMDYALYSNFTNSNGSVPSNLNLGISLYGTVPMEFGKLGFQLGGINWTDVSGMTFSSFAGYDRFSLFERWAWEGIGQSSDRASLFLETGRINREERWARQAFKGILVDLYELPWGLSTRVLYGKTPATISLDDNVPRFTVGGRLRKNVGSNHVGFNSMNYVQYEDSTAQTRSGIGLHTADVQWSFDKFQITAEGGIAERYSPDGTRETGEGVRVNIMLDSSLTKLPIEVGFFRLSPQFINYYGNFLSLNTQFLSDAASQSVAGGGGGATNFVGSITDVGQILNNRQGFTLNTWWKKKNTSINVGSMISQEMERLSNRLSFGHKINGQTLSRFAPFATGVGPYRRWTSFYRGVAEELFITDVDTTGLPMSKIHFNTVQLQFKQRMMLKDKALYLLYIGTYGSAADKFSVLPIFDDGAYLRTSYSEFDLIYDLSKTFDVSLAFGLERIQGNSQTNNIYYLDDSGALAGATITEDELIDGTYIPAASYEGASTPSLTFVNQKSRMIGAGVDVKLSPHSGLYIRHRRFWQKDDGFTADDIEGTETTIELKVYF
ncbi:MAG: hypothetical protein P8H59_06555 [Flavobacteriales bacterium]|nr:hypothetical protein [Flavobacteriales bacterium]MDG1780591.1 hypothetical protein [Flavobacteriales bacterium]MDG2246380.1 hypothetical protein [Flavobacteriales bacterium]